MVAAITDKLTYVGKRGTITTLQAPGKAIGDASVKLTSLNNWPTLSAVVFFIRKIDLSTKKEVPGTYTEWLGIVNTGASIVESLLLLDGTDQIYPADSSVQVGIHVQATWENRLIDGLLNQHNKDGTHHDITSTNATLTNATITNLTVGSQTPSADWTPIGTNPASIVYNGNRSYNMTWNGVDYTNILSPGQRGRTTRTIAAPTYMGGLLNGTSQYFTKVTPTGTLATVTDNFTLKATIQPTSYPATRVYISGRADVTPNNGLGIAMEATGQITAIVFNGGTANSRVVTTVQSVALSKKTNIFVSWAGGVVAVYFDGISVPVGTATTGGTAPTTAGLGGDFSVGRFGAYASGLLFPGYISDAGIFNAVLSATTVQSYYSQALLGTETNCIGAWSLNNTAVNQQAPGTNDLTAMGSAGYTNIAPYSTQASGLPNGLLDYFINMSTTFVGGNTVVVAQVPEGCTIPTSGGVSAVAYSGVKVPYGFPAQKAKWKLLSLNVTQQSSAPGAAIWSNVGTLLLDVPIGSWVLSYASTVQATVTANNDLFATLSTSTTSETDKLLTTSGLVQGSGQTASGFPMTRTNDAQLSSQTKYYHLIKSTAGGTVYLRGDNSAAVIIAENSYL